MLQFSPAKVNIGLYVTGKRLDGYHSIDSIFLPIALYDAVELLPSSKNSIHCYGRSIPGSSSENSCLKALRLMQSEFKIGNYAIHLYKTIPTGAGLGGGSSNASTVIKLINQLERLQLSQEKLEELSLTIGSDNAFFIENKPKYVTGRGENLSSAALNLEGFKLAVIYPNAHQSTKEAYEHITIDAPDVQLETLDKEQFLSKVNQIKNSFEQSFIAKFPKTKTILRQLKASGAIYSSLTGSGSAFYGIFHPTIEIPYSLEQFATQHGYDYFETYFI